MDSDTNDTPVLDDTVLDERVDSAIELARSTPGMHVTLHHLDEQQLLDYARRHDRTRYLQVTEHGDDPADAGTSLTVEQTVRHAVILFADPGPHAQRVARDRVAERELHSAAA